MHTTITRRLKYLALPVALAAKASRMGPRWRHTLHILFIGSCVTLSGCPFWDMAPAPAPLPLPTASAQFLTLRLGGSDGERYYESIKAVTATRRDTFSAFFLRNGFSAPPPVAGSFTPAAAKYFNAGDLNLGRDMQCNGNAERAACFVSNHATEMPGIPFPDDATAALASLAGSGQPFATVAMEYVAPVTDPPVSLDVRECDGVPTPPGIADRCGLDTRPPINVGEITLPAPGKDVDTAIDIAPGDTLSITAGGSIDVGFLFGTPNGPDGESKITNDPKLPLPASRPYGLIGRVGVGGPYFPIGSDYSSVHSGAKGRLFLRTNDDLPGNGWGRFNVTVTVKRASVVKFFVYGGANGEQLLTTAALDSQGPKSVPGICLACHGGRYDAATHTVQGAAFLPFNLKSFKYSTLPGLSRAEQEERFRKLNAIVKATRRDTPQPDAITDFIDGMYRPANVETPGTVSRDDHVPEGWATDPNLYLGVIRPYCATCHVALGKDRDLEFLRLDQVTNKRAQMADYVCGRLLMPHAETTFRHFWTDDAGLWPGVLADSLRLGACPQQ